MEFSAHTKFAVFMVALLALCVPSVNAQCVRLKYYGSSINYIHKAHEEIHELLQYAKVDTVVYFIASAKSFDLPTNTVFEDYLYFVTDESRNTVRKLLALRVSSKNGSYFVDDYAMLDVIATADPTTTYSYILTNRFKFTVAAVEAAYDAAVNPTPTALYECRLVKEEFTFFYEMYPSRFQKIVN